MAVAGDFVFAGGYGGLSCWPFGAHQPLCASLQASDNYAEGYTVGAEIAWKHIMVLEACDSWQALVRLTQARTAFLKYTETKAQQGNGCQLWYFSKLIHLAKHR